MKARINSYLATLLITIVGAAAALTIIRVADANAGAFASAIDTDAHYADLKASILGSD